MDVKSQNLYYCILTESKAKCIFKARRREHLKCGDLTLMDIHHCSKRLTIVLKNSALHFP